MHVGRYIDTYSYLSADMRMEPSNFGTSEKVSSHSTYIASPVAKLTTPASIFLAVSMHLLYVLKCSQFFNTLDTDFFPADSPDDDEEEEEGEESGRGAKKHKIKHVSRFQPLP